MMTTRAGAVLLAACLLLPLAVAAADFEKAIFERERASDEVRRIADWVMHARDNRVGEKPGAKDARLPFAILDKKDARVYVFDKTGRLRGAAPALLGLGIGDTAVPGLGARELSNIAPKDRITQAGRFVSQIGLDSKGEDVLWLDYQDSLAMHRVITTNPKERRTQRLATPTPSDNRISYGCINIPVKFYEDVVRPVFIGTKGIVYVLPETKPVHSVFASYEIEDATAEPQNTAAGPQPMQSPLRRVSAQEN